MPSSIASGSTCSLNRTPRSRKKSNKRRLRKGEREVLVHSCLPPQVDGQIRCFVVVQLKKITWKTNKQLDNAFLRCLWWGENPDSAAIFSPLENKVVARYPVRSGPKQMASYLIDAGTVHVEVLRGADMSVIGKVQIYGLSALAAGKSLTGPFPIFSTKSEIIGHINVNISMQALHAFDDSGGSSIVPTTDLDNTKHSESQIVGYEKLDSRLGTPSAYSSFVSQPQVNNDGKRHTTPTKKQRSRSDINGESRESSLCASHDDLISNLLVKGQRLRSAMISSAVDSVCAVNRPLEFNDAITPFETQFPESKNVLSSITNPPHESPQKRHHPELKTVELVLGSPQEKAIYVSDTDSGGLDDIDLSDFEDPAHDQEILDLLFYKTSTKAKKLSTQFDAMTSTNVRDNPSLEKTRHLDDMPSQHLNAIGKDSASTGQMNLDNPGNVRPPSRGSMTSPGVCLSPALSNTGNQSDSGTSRVSFDMTASDDEDTRSAAEGLSVEQLTLLARVSVARVHIDKLTLQERPTTPVEKKTYKGRPPPAKLSKYGTYFVEYQFPVVAASRDQTERNTLATETVRAVSKKVDKTGVVTWNHHTVFPVFFDGQAVEKWWNSMLVFKIHHRETTSRTARLIGSCSIQMKQILQSLTFGLDLELSVTKIQKRNTSIKRRRRRRADVIGCIKCNVQLDSDSPSFATALRELQINKARKQHPLLRPKPETPIVIPDKAEYVKSKELMKIDIQHKQRGYKPADQYDQVPPTMPLHVTKDVLQNMSNNYMIVEIWEKRSLAQKDQLIGYAKLPLNTFYMSYKEPRIAQVLIKSQYPVIAVDSYLPITNPLTGKNMGEVKVLLAMGSQPQIMSLQTLKVLATVTELDSRQQSEANQNAHIPYGNRTVYNTPAERDGQPLYSNDNEHRFDIKVVAVRDLQLDDDMYLGEADCFVQYHFPAQHNQPDGLVMKSFRSPTTLCTNNVTFEDHHSHIIILPRETNLQTALTSAFGSIHGSTVPFELWCRFYHPNTRDQLMARSLLPLAKLLALVIMCNNEPVSCQSYSLPLLPAPRDSNKVGSVGVLDISIRHTKKSCDPPPSIATNSHDLYNLGQITLATCIESVIGLKSAALALSRKHQCLDYYSAVGVNFYVKLMLSFQSRNDVRVSDTEARVLCLEEFGFRSQFSLPLIIDNTTSLAHCLHTGCLIIEVWHQSLKDSLLDDCPGIAPSTDIQLGVASVPLTNLLSHKTGVRGWYAVNPPPELYTTAEPHDPMMGALKVQLKLNGSQDIANIIDSASRMGYRLPSPGLDVSDTVIDELTELVFEVDWFTIPSNMVLRSDQEVLPISTVCYLKTSFFNNDVTYSNALRLADKGENFECRSEVRFKYLHTVSHSFLWHLFDQCLELELWFSSRRDGVGEDITPSSSDKYLGTAYIPLEPLSQRRRCTISDVYPIYKPATERMGRSLIQVHVCRKPHQETELHHMKSRRIECTDEAPVAQLNDMNCSDQSEDDSMDEDTIEATVSIEEANRLTIGQSPGTSLHVTYSLAGREHMTPGVCASNKPCWGYEKCIRLHLPSILQSKHLVLKMWSKSEDKGSQVIGFTTIDLRPLLAGMSHLSGWYNIVDFTGLCQGQIKCGIQPLTPFTLKKEGYEASSPRYPKPSPELTNIVHQEKYVTGCAYSEYPSHISRYTEQVVSLCPPHIGSTSASSASELLSKQLAELDVITNNLRRKLYRPAPSESPPPPASQSKDNFGLAVTPSTNQLMTGVRQMGHNFTELANQGAANPDDVVVPEIHLPFSEHQADARHSDRSATSRQSSNNSTSRAPSSSADTERNPREPSSDPCSDSGLNKGAEGDSPFTPRTQATYSMTSEDEQFSPPIYVKSDNRTEHMLGCAGTVESSDWASDIKTLESGGEDHLSADSANQNIFFESVDPRRTTKGQANDRQTSADASIVGSDMEDELSQDGADKKAGSGAEEVSTEEDCTTDDCGDNEGDDGGGDDMEYQEEEAVSRTINDQLSPPLSPILADEDVTEQAFGTFHDSSLLMADDSRDMIETEDAQKATTNVTHLEIPNLSAEPRDSSQSISRVKLDKDLTQSVAVEIAESHSDFSETNTEDYVIIDQPNLEVDIKVSPHIIGRQLGGEPTGSEYKLRREEIVLSETENHLPLEPPHSTRACHTAARIPSFFPSKDELAAKMMAAKKSPSRELSGRFGPLKSIAQIVRERVESTDRAKKVADIFATRFDK